MERIEPLGKVDLNDAEALVAEAGWNQDAADWRIFLQLGAGLAARDADGSLAGTAAMLPYACGFGWISMVLVKKSCRRRGIATRLLQRCIDKMNNEGVVPVLDATPAGREVYKPLGFKDGWPITRWRRSGPVPASRTGDVRVLQDSDWAGVCALDARAFGCERTALLEQLRARSSGFACVCETFGILRGFLLGREGRVATQLGPIVAEDESTAISLTAWASAHVATPIIVDVLDCHRALGDWLVAHGYAKERPYIRMVLGRDEPFGDATRMIAIAGPELG